MKVKNNCSITEKVIEANLKDKYYIKLYKVLKL